MGKQRKVGILNEAENHTVAHLDPHATVVICKSFPYPWVLRKLFAHAPYIEVIALSEKFLAQVRENALCMQICKEQVVTLRTVSNACKLGDFEKSKHRELYGSVQFHKYREFFATLDPERQSRFEEVRAFGFNEITIACRYLCLKAEEYTGSTELARQLHCSPSTIHISVGVLLQYLDAPFEVSKESVRKTKQLKVRIVRARRCAEESLAIERRMLNAELTTLPTGMTIRYAIPYGLVLRAWQRDQLRNSALSIRERDILIERYGLLDGIFKRLQVLGKKRGLTRQMIHVLELSALQKLRECEGPT
ncbi:MAG: hypothetical protein AAB605_00910 [Patescibacteria group bacterium]